MLAYDQSGMPYETTSDARERARLRALGQPDLPPDVTVEGPNDYMPPEEQQTLFPKGLPTTEKEGGLAALARASRSYDAFNRNATQGPPPAATPPPQSADAPDYQPQQRHWFTGADAALAKVDKQQREVQDIGQVAKAGGTLVRMAATYGAGGAGGMGGMGAGGAGAGAGAAAGAGAEAGAGGAAAGAAPAVAGGTETGAGATAPASSQTGFGENFLKSFQGGKGEGIGGYAGKYVRDNYTSAGQMSGGGGGESGLSSGMGTRDLSANSQGSGNKGFEDYLHTVAGSGGKTASSLYLLSRLRGGLSNGDLF